MTPLEDLELRAFDPPFLGIPAHVGCSGRALGPDGRFVELFLDLDGRTVRDAGFLTDIPGEGMLCASFWCEAAFGADMEKARAITEADLLSRFPPSFPPPREAARLCVRAGLKALGEAQ